MKLMMLAARNLFRNLRRTLITLAAISFGLVFIHLTITLQTGQYHLMIKQGISTMAGHVVVQAEGYQEERDPDLVIANSPTIERELQEAFPEAVIAPRLALGGLLTSTTSSVGVILSGVEPGAEAQVQTLPENIVEGTWLDDNQRGILIGAKLAESLNVSVGQKLVYMGQHGDSTEMTSQLFRVKGIFKTGGASIDGFFSMVPIAAARKLMGGDVSHQVTVHLEDPTFSIEATDHAKSVLSNHVDTQVLHWSEAIPQLYGLIQLDRTSGDIGLSLLGIIVAMGVLNTVLMSALERTREFGVMLAIGLRPYQLSQLILLEGAVLGVMGAGLGLMFGALASYPLVEYGLDFAALSGTDTVESAGVVMSGILYGAYNPVRMLNYTMGAVVLTTLAAAYPAFHVAGLRPVDAMRHV